MLVATGDWYLKRISLVYEWLGGHVYLLKEFDCLRCAFQGKYSVYLYYSILIKVKKKWKW